MERGKKKKGKVKINLMKNWIKWWNQFTNITNFKWCKYLIKNSKLLEKSMSNYC